MKLPDIIRRARRNLAQAKGRTILTSLAIAVGAFTVTLALAAGAGGRAYTSEIINSSGDAASLSVYANRDTPTDTSGMREYGKEAEEVQVAKYMLGDADVRKIAAIDGVQSVTPQYGLQVLYVTSDQNDKKFEAPVSVKDDGTEMKLTAGTLTDGIPRIGEVVVSESLLKDFGIASPSAAIGKQLTLHVPKLGQVASVDTPLQAFSFKIGAVDTRAQTSFFYQESVRVSPTDAKRIYEYQAEPTAAHEYGGLTVRATSGEAAVSVQSKLKQDKRYAVYSLQDSRKSMMETIDVVQWGLVGFGALAIIASIFGIVNTQYISVLERTQQIGLMKALGMSRVAVGRLFLIEAAWVGFLGGLLGTVLALLVGLANPLISSALNLEAGTKLLLFEPLTSIGLIAILMGVAILSGYFPSRKAAKLDPIEALRTE